MLYTLTMSNASTISCIVPHSITFTFLAINKTSALKMDSSRPYLFKNNLISVLFCLGNPLPAVVQLFYEKRSNKLQQKQTQQILYPQYVLSKEKKTSEESH